MSVLGFGGHAAGTLFGKASTRLKAEVDRLSPRVLFVQATNPGAYPPLIHASMLMAEAGWEVTFLSAPIAGDRLALPSHPRVKIHAVRDPPVARHEQASITRFMRPRPHGLHFDCGRTSFMRQILSEPVPDFWLRVLPGQRWSIMSTTVRARNAASRPGAVCARRRRERRG